MHNQVTELQEQLAQTKVHLETVQADLVKRDLELSELRSHADDQTLEEVVRGLERRLLLQEKVIQGKESELELLGAGHHGEGEGERKVSLNMSPRKNM